MNLRDQVTPFLQDLVKETGLTAHLAILEEREAVLISKFEPPGMFRLATWVGKRMDLHCTGVGKSLMACLSKDEVDQIIGSMGCHATMRIRYVRADEWKRSLVRIAQRGYAVDDEEDELGLRCIGSPVFGADDVLVASISIAGTNAQITSRNLMRVAERVRRTAGRISQALAQVPVAPKEFNRCVAVPGVHHGELVVPVGS